jgi:hypothetical protein
MVGREYLENENNIRTADIPILQKILTGIVRTDRCSEGYFEEIINNG